MQMESLGTLQRLSVESWREKNKNCEGNGLEFIYYNQAQE